MSDVSHKVDRLWQSHERNYSGNRVGIWRDGEWTIIRMESGGADTTTSIRKHEAWDMALRLSPELKERLDELFEADRAKARALHSLTWREVDTATIRKIASEWDCGRDCEYVGGRCPEIDREGCKFADADSLKDLADALDLASTTTEYDVLRAIDSCGGSHSPEDTASGYAKGYDDALDAAEREVRRLFARALPPPPETKP